MRSASWPRRASTPASCSGRWRSLASGLFALGVGALSLRTRGVYFIMITLAFAQMVYYVAIGLDRYGGDDGLTIYKRSQFGDPINLSNKTVFYYLCFALLLATVYLVWRLVNSRFGMVIQGARSNERRMRAIGFPTFRYKLTCFVISGVICGLAGVLLANHTDFINPVDHELDALGRSDRHGGAGRHGHGVRPGDRRGRVLLLEEGCCRSFTTSSRARILAVISARCCCWSRFTRAAASTAF